MRKWYTAHNPVGASTSDGQVEIDKGKKFQQELGQWTAENGAFMKV